MVVCPSFRRCPSSHPGVGVVELCGSAGDWSGRSAPKRVSGSVDREWCDCCRVGSSVLPGLPAFFSHSGPVGLACFGTPALWTADRHVPLSCADLFHVLWLMLKSFSEAGALPLLKHAKQQSLWESVIRHASYVSWPATLGLHQDGVEARQVSTGEDLSVWDLVLPLYAKKFPEAAGVEVVQLPIVALIDRPCFIAIEQCGENNGPVHLDLFSLW